jgi:predicted regulator of Ras-like GTPase activity (Roadblock/LC7/MglB family)
MFKHLFSKLEAALPGLKSAAVVGQDGIEVDVFVKEDLPHEILSAEMNGILRTMDRLRSELALGTLSEVVIRTDTQNILLTALSEGLFLLLVTGPSETTGKVRYETQRLAHEFVEAVR